MSIFQLGAILFALLMFYVVNIHRRKLRLSKIELGSWYSVWGLFIVVAIFPDSVKGIAQNLNFARTFDLLVVVALMILTTITITSFFIQRETNNKIEDLVRKIALDKSKNSK